jgi:hypothetical protein
MDNPLFFFCFNRGYFYTLDQPFAVTPLITYMEPAESLAVDEAHGNYLAGMAAVFFCAPTADGILLWVLSVA